MILCSNNYSLTMNYKRTRISLIISMSTTNDMIIERQSGIYGLIDNFKKPQHIGVPRKEIFLPFAVQLMRQVLFSYYL